MRIFMALGLAAGLMGGPLGAQERKPRPPQDKPKHDKERPGKPRPDGDKERPEKGGEKEHPEKPRPDGEKKKHDCSRDAESFEKELPRQGDAFERQAKLRRITDHFREKHSDGGRCHCSCAHPEGDHDAAKGGEKPRGKGKGNNGVGNGEDPQPPGNPPVNDGPGAGKGRPGNRGGAK
jgi:hypothetical protein